MDSDNELSAGSVSLGSITRGDVEVPHGDSPAKESSVVSSRDAITRKIRNPLLKSEETTPIVQVQVSLASSEPPLRTAAELAPPIDISENIHPFPQVAQGKHDDKSSGGLARARYKGLAIVVAVVVAGTAVDIFLWRTSSARHARTAPLAGAISTSTAFSNAADLPGSASATSTVPIVEPLPDRSHSEVRGKTADVALAPDGIGARGSNKTLDVAKDPLGHVLEASATDLVASSRSASASEDADRKVGVRRDQPPVRPASEARSSQSALKPKKDVRVKSTPKGGDDFGTDLRATSTRRPTTTIDEMDPYSP